MTTSNMGCSLSRLFPGATVARSGKEDCDGSRTVNVVAYMFSRWALAQRYRKVIGVRSVDVNHLREGLFGSHGLRYAQTRQAIIRPNVRSGCAPCKGGASQWVQAPPGSRSMESLVLRAPNKQNGAASRL
jgi:hypothetical protein